MHDGVTARARTLAPPVLFWAGIALLLGGFVGNAMWHAVSLGSSQLVALTLIAAAVAALLHWPARCSMATAVAVVGLGALIYFAGVWSVLAVLLIALAALGLGSIFVPAEWHGRAALSTVVGLALLCGVDGWLLPYRLHFRLVYGLVLLALVVWRHRAIVTLLRPLRRAWTDAVNGARWPAALALLAIVAASTWAWLPTTLYDDLAYHLALPSQLADLGYYQMNAGTNVWAVAAWASDVLQGIAQVLAGVESRGAVDVLWFGLSCVLLWQLARALELSVPRRWLAVALFASLPLTMILLHSMQTEGPTVTVMLALALVITGAAGTPQNRHPGARGERPWMAASLRSEEGRDPLFFRIKAKWINSPLLRLALRAVGCADVRSGILPPQSACAGMTSKKVQGENVSLAALAEAKPRVDARTLLVMGLLLGLLIGLKVSNVWFAAPLGGWWLWRTRCRLPWRWLPLAIALGVLVAGSSYVYAWVLAGNPVLPVFNGVFHSPWFPPTNFHDARWDAGFNWSIVWNLVFHPGRYVEGGSIGPMLLLALAGSFLVALVRPRARALAAVGVVALLLPLSQIQYWRYAYPALALLIPTLLCGVSAPQGERLHARCMSVALWLVAGVSLVFAGSAGWQVKTGALGLRVASGKAAVVAHYAPVRAALAVLHRRYGRYARVLVLDSQAPFAASMAGRAFVADWYDPTLSALAAKARAAGGAAGWLALLRRSGVNVLVTRKTKLPAGLAQAIQTRAGKQVYAEDGVLAWRLPPLRGARATHAADGRWQVAFDTRGAPRGDTLVYARLAFHCSTTTAGASGIVVQWRVGDAAGDHAHHRQRIACGSAGYARAAVHVRVPARVTGLRATLEPSANLTLRPASAKASVRRDLTAQRNLARRLWPGVTGGARGIRWSSP